MRTAIAAIAVLMLAGSAQAGENGEGAAPGLPAFPGAEGFGAVSTGGRGGKVIKVTNLNNSGPGSLAAALATAGPRIIVFEVSGVIAPAKAKYGKIDAAEGKVTIAGQTAPAPGIMMEGQLRFQGDFSDIIIRHFRVRSTAEDAIRLGSCRRAIVDHCSFTWGGDETIDLSGAKDITLQWTTIEASALNWEGGDEAHNFGVLMSEGPLTFHHLLFAHHHDRAPSDYRQAHDVDSRNNVMYNFGTTMHSRSGNLVGNYLKSGPGAVWGIPRIYHPPVVITQPGLSWAESNNKDHSYPTYLRGNYLDWAGGYYQPSGGKSAPGEKENPAAPVATTVAEQAYEDVCAGAGALPRDEITAKCIYEVRTRTGQWGREEPPGDWRARMAGGKPLPDADGDGLPDYWEKAHGLDPADPADGNKTVPAGASRGDRHKGYTYIEFYINERADILEAEQLTADRLRVSDGEAPPRPDWKPLPKSIDELVADIDMQHGKIDKTNTGTTWRAIWALKDAGPAAAPAAEKLAKVMDTDDNRKALFAAWALGIIAPYADEKAVVPVLIKQLGHDYPVNNTKWNMNPKGFIAWALGRFGPRGKEAVPALAEALHGKDLWAHQPAAWALAEMGKEAAPATDVLVKALGAEGGPAWGCKGNLQYFAARALAGVGGPAIPAVIAALGDKKAEVRRGAAMALGLMGPTAKGAAEPLRKLLADGDPAVRSEATLALAAVAPAEEGAIDGIAGLLADADCAVRANAALALERAGPAAAAALPALKKALGDDSGEVRFAAARALGKLGAAAVPALAEALAGKGDGWLRARCAQALGLAASGDGSAEAAGALAAALSDKDPAVRREAVWALGRLGTAAAKAKAALEKAAAEDPDYIVTHAAVAVTQRISGGK